MSPRPSRKAVDAYHHGDLRDALVQAALHEVELGGPEVLTMAELNRRIARAQGRERALIPVPDALCGLFAALPGTPMTSDQWRMLQRGSVADAEAPGISALGIVARPLGLFLERWMMRYRKHGRFGDKREIVAEHRGPAESAFDTIV